MPVVNLDLQGPDAPVGPLRDRIEVDISSRGYRNDCGFICEVLGAGSLTYRTHEGAADQTEPGMGAGDTVEVAGIPVVLRAVRSSSSVTRIAVGLL